MWIQKQQRRRREAQGEIYGVNYFWVVMGSGQEDPKYENDKPWDSLRGERKCKGKKKKKLIFNFIIFYLFSLIL